MIQKIGKYQIIERIGRGGMGSVFKAHDPVLERSVALKVISPDIEVTDALRTRFFREAQACARLNHPNIVTVYDLAEVDGHLFIVMELLEGEELRGIISRRKPIALEDKLAIMIQVCDGLAYAHQRGVVHRDVKPGNVFVLHDGSVKIVDFGIARIMNSDSDLTRKGLVMGTLRYMAPEQAQGRADQRSDVFSVGAVFYELLVYRQAFPGDDPMVILEALRSHPPPLLHEVDPAIPAELGKVIAGALTRDPQQRLAELGTMRRELDRIRRRLVDEAERLRTSLEPLLAEARRLHAAVVEQAGRGPALVEPVLPERADVAALRAFEPRLTATIERLRRVLADAAALEPKVARGLELVRDGKVEAAMRELESVLEALPQHERATAALAEARGQLGEERRREQARVDTLRGQVSEARRDAEQVGAVNDAAATWGTAELMVREAEAALEDESHAKGLERFEAALQLYRRAATEAREAGRRRARATVDAARHEVVGAREIAAGLEAPVTAAEPWGSAVAHEARATAAAERLEWTNALEHLAAARRQYEHAAEVARADLRRREREAATDGQERMKQLRQVAEEVEAHEHARAEWRAAESARTAGEAALAQQDHRTAAERFEDARQDLRRAIDESRAAVQTRRRHAAETSRARAAAARQLAEQARASTLAAERWHAAEDKQRQGDFALQRGDFTGAQTLFADAGRAFDDAADIARREQLKVSAPAPMVTRTELPTPGSPTEATRVMPADEATRLAETRLIPGPVPHEAGAPSAPRQGAVGARGAGIVAPRHSRRRSTTIALAAMAIIALVVVGLSVVWAPWRPTPTETAAKAKRGAAEALQQQVVEARQAAEKAGAPQRAAAPFQRAATAEARGDAARKARDWAGAEAGYFEALQSYQEASAEAVARREPETGREADREGVNRHLAAVESAQAAASGARQKAERAERESLASIQDARKAQDADATRRAREEDTRARDDAARKLKADQERAAIEERERARKAEEVAALERKQRADADARREIDRMRRELAPRRDQAVKSEADVLAKDLFESGAAKEKEAEQLANALDVSGARQPYADAGNRYDEARLRAVEVGEQRKQANSERSRMETAKGQASAVPPKPTPEPPSTATPFPPFAGSDAETEIKKVLDQWKRAFETKDLALVQRLRPAMKDEELRRLGETFENARSYQLDLRVETLKIARDEAQARTFKRDVMTARDGQIHQSESTVTVVLRRQGGGWTIADIK